MIGTLEHKYILGIGYEGWSGRTGDLNPTEHFWDELKSLPKAQRLLCWQKWEKKKENTHGWSGVHKLLAM